MLIEDILTQAGVEFERLHQSPELILPCPFCVGQSDVSGERKVFGVNTESGFAHCMRCDWGSKSVVYTARELCKAYGIDFTWRLRLSAAQIEQAAAEPKKAAKPLEEPIPVGLPREYERFQRFANGGDAIELRAWSYLKSRRVTMADVDRYRIGFAAAGYFSWRLLFPVFGDDNQIYGCVGRDFSGTVGQLPYLNTSGIKLLWNGHRRADRIVIGEGVMDGVQLNTAIRPTLPGTVAAAALGSIMTPQQLAQIAKYKTAIHFPDFDVPGVKGAMKRADATQAAGIETLMVMPEHMTGDDPGSMLASDILSYVRNAQPWTKSAKLRLRLRMFR